MCWRTRHASSLAELAFNVVPDAHNLLTTKETLSLTRCHGGASVQSPRHGDLQVEHGYSDVIPYSSLPSPFEGSVEFPYDDPSELLAVLIVIVSVVLAGHAGTVILL